LPAKTDWGVTKRESRQNAKKATARIIDVRLETMGFDYTELQPNSTRSLYKRASSMCVHDAASFLVALRSRVPTQAPPQSDEANWGAPKAPSRTQVEWCVCPIISLAIKVMWTNCKYLSRLGVPRSTLCRPQSRRSIRNPGPQELSGFDALSCATTWKNRKLFSSKTAFKILFLCNCKAGIGGNSTTKVSRDEYMGRNISFTQS
jgi:hypothetical protein